MTKNEEIAAYLRFLAKEWEPSEKFQDRMADQMNTPVSRQMIGFGKAMLLAAADQIERGLPAIWAGQKEED